MSSQRFTRRTSQSQVVRSRFPPIWSTRKPAWTTCPIRLACPDALVTSDDDQVAAGDDRNPVDVKHTHGTLGNQRTSRVNRVASSRRQGLAQSKRALVNEEP